MMPITLGLVLRLLFRLRLMIRAERPPRRIARRKRLFQGFVYLLIAHLIRFRGGALWLLLFLFHRPLRPAQICYTVVTLSVKRPDMKTLLLLRHAKSSWQDPNLSDFERPLNGRGLKAAPL